MTWSGGAARNPAGRGEGNCRLRRASEESEKGWRQGLMTLRGGKEGELTHTERKKHRLPHCQGPRVTP